MTCWNIIDFEICKVFLITGRPTHTTFSVFLRKKPLKIKTTNPPHPPHSWVITNFCTHPTWVQNFVITQNDYKILYSCSVITILSTKFCNHYKWLQNFVLAEGNQILSLNSLVSSDPRYHDRNLVVDTSIISTTTTTTTPAFKVTSVSCN